MAESKAAKDAYIKKVDQKLFGGKKSASSKDEEAVRDARGTSGFLAACDAYVEKGARDGGGGGARGERVHRFPPCRHS